MRVAARATIGHAEERGSDRIGDVIQNLLAPLPQIAGIAFVGIMTIEAGRDSRPGIVRPQLISGDLLFHEAVVWLVLIERLNDVIAVAPGVRAGLVGFEPFTFGVSGEVQPMTRPPLAIVRRGEQPVDNFLVRVGRFVGDESVYFFGRRRKADQIQTHAPQKRDAIRAPAQNSDPSLPVFRR